MIKPSFITNILLPETIEKLGMERIYEIDKIGSENHYRIHLTTKSLPHNIPTSQTSLANKRVQEIASTSHIAHDMTDIEKNLFKAALRFPNDDTVLLALEGRNISKEDIMELNNIIKEVQESYIKYTFTIIKLEKAFDLKYDQVVNIIKLTPAVINSNYELSKEDKEYYRHAQIFLHQLKPIKSDWEKKLTSLLQHKTFEQLVRISQEHYSLATEEISMVINKINKILVTEPDKILNGEQMQKKYSR